MHNTIMWKFKPVVMGKQCFLLHPNASIQYYRIIKFDWIATLYIYLSQYYYLEHKKIKCV